LAIWLPGGDLPKLASSPAAAPRMATLSQSQLSPSQPSVEFGILILRGTSTPSTRNRVPPHTSAKINRQIQQDIDRRVRFLSCHRIKWQEESPAGGRPLYKRFCLGAARSWMNSNTGCRKTRGDARKADFRNC